MFVIAIGLVGIASATSGIYYYTSLTTATGGVPTAATAATATATIPTAAIATATETTKPNLEGDGKMSCPHVCTFLCTLNKTQCVIKLRKRTYQPTAQDMTDLVRELKCTLARVRPKIN